MFRIDREFAYIITDPGTTEADMERRSDMAEEGYNLAFIYNREGDTNCARGLAHLASNIGAALVGGYEQTMMGEMPLFEEVEINIISDSFYI